MILNSGYEPIKVVSWQKAIILWLQDKVEVLEYHTIYVHSASATFQLPSVLRLRSYVRPYFGFGVKLSRQNIFLRDNKTCQYCHKHFSEKKLTIDHVLPISRGGRHEWSNVVAACSQCNNKKGSLTPVEAGMNLLRTPSKPRWLPSWDLDVREHSVPPAWKMYLQFKAS